MLRCRTGEISLCMLAMALILLVIAVPTGACTTPTPTPTPAPSQTPGWYDCGWNYRQGIVIDHTKVAGYLSNFTVLISLPSDVNLSSHAQTNGNDIFFTQSDGTTRLSHEIESYTSSTGALVAWVRIPALSASSNTTLYMYYGNPGAPNQQNPAAAWDPKFAGVWHLTGSFSDSTSNSNNAVNIGSTDTPGQIAGGRSFNGVSNYLNLGTSTSLQPSELTVSFWIKRTADWDNKQKYLIWAKGTKGAMEYTNGWYLDSYDLGGRNTPINLVVDGMNGYNGPISDIDTYYPLNTWTYMAVTFSTAKDTAALYKNGVSQTFTSWGDPESITATSDPKTLAFANATYVPGAYDEVRISSTGRSSLWIQTEYNNENSPSTFSSLQAEQYIGAYSTCILPTPVAAFSATPTSGKAPLTVAFTDQSTNTPTSWSWTFGDGGTSTLQNPTYVYNTAGTFNVTLIAANGYGSSTLMKQAYVTVTPKTPPVAAFSATSTSGKAPLTVSFTDQSTNNPTSWSWSFGDGGTSTLQNPTYVYYAAGTYTVTLTATNGDGSNTTVVQNLVTVTPKTPPVAAFSATPTSGKVPLSVAFTDTSTNNPTSWSWSFGDGGTSTLQNPTYTYNTAGTYSVTLTVTNAGGSNTIVMQNLVTVTPKTPPVASFSAAPTSGKVPLTVTFTDQSTNNPTSWSWSFGDGGTSTLQNPSYMYYTAGTYNVSLTVSNADGSNTLTQQNLITVSLDCGDSQSLVTSDGTTVGCVAVSNDATSLYVTFTGSSTDPLVTANWAWGYSTANIPASSGIPDPARFSYSYTFGAGTLSYAFPGVDISQALNSDTSYLTISAHATTASGKNAWASSPDWGTYYFAYYPS